MMAATRPGPRRVLLFSGHMLDSPTRARPRFPARKVDAVALGIEALVAGLDPRPADIAIGSAACGADLLFARALRTRGVPLQLYLPEDASEFIERSVAFAGPRWVGMFNDLAGTASLHVLSPERCDGANIWDSCNRWMLDEAKRQGSSITMLCLHTEGVPDGPGGTAEFAQLVRQAGGEVLRIDPDDF